MAGQYQDIIMLVFFLAYVDQYLQLETNNENKTLPVGRERKYEERNE
jgi:hypothetical protein